MSAARLDADQIAAARLAVDLADLIGSTVALVPRGKEFVGLCPFHAEKNPSFTVVPDRGFYKCFGCGAKGSAIDWIMHRDGRSFRDAVAFLLDRTARGAVHPAAAPSAAVRGPARACVDSARRIRSAWRLWTAARPIAAGDPAWRYLEGRLCLVSPIPPVLRFHPRLSHPEFRDPTTRQPLRTWPGLVARVDSPHGTFAGIHRIYLAANGTGIVQDAELKARRLAKLSLGVLVGGAIRLISGVDAIGLAEGIEDALSAHILTGLPVWSCVDSGKLMRVELPRGVGDVTIFADRDRPQVAPGRLYAPDGIGLRAARHLKARLEAEGRSVRVLLPSGDRHDFNDELVVRRARSG